MDWPAALERLDRQSGWRAPSPDQVGLVDLMRLYDVPAVGISVRQDGTAPWSHTYGSAVTTPCCSRCWKTSRGRSSPS